MTTAKIFENGRSQAKEKNRLALIIFLSEIPILPFDDLAAQTYGRVKGVNTGEQSYKGLCQSGRVNRRGLGIRRRICLSV